MRLRRDTDLVWATLTTGPATGEVDSWVVAETVKVMVYGFLTVAITSGRYKTSDRPISIG